MSEWARKWAETREADGDEWDRLSDAYGTEWTAAYCVEFRRFAAERGWSQESIESGWLDDMPGEAFFTYEAGADPAACARRDVPECEEHADSD